MRTVYNGDLNLMNAVLMGGLAILEDVLPDIQRILGEQKKDYLAQGLETVLTALRWTSLQIDDMIARAQKAPECAVQHSGGAAQ